MLKIVKEDLTSCINSLNIPVNNRYYVVDTPINKTGVCKQFDTKRQAVKYLRYLKLKWRVITGFNPCFKCIICYI